MAMPELVEAVALGFSSMLVLVLIGLLEGAIKDD